MCQRLCGRKCRFEYCKSWSSPCQCGFIELSSPELSSFPSLTKKRENVPTRGSSGSRARDEPRLTQDARNKGGPAAARPIATPGDSGVRPGGRAEGPAAPRHPRSHALCTHAPAHATSCSPCHQPGLALGGAIIWHQKTSHFGPPIPCHGLVLGACHQPFRGTSSAKSRLWPAG